MLNQADFYQGQHYDLLDPIFAVGILGVLLLFWKLLILRVGVGGKGKNPLEGAEAGFGYSSLYCVLNPSTTMHMAATSEGGTELVV